MATKKDKRAKGEAKALAAGKKMAKDRADRARAWDKAERKRKEKERMAARSKSVQEDFAKMRPMSQDGRGAHSG